MGNGNFGKWDAGKVGFGECGIWENRGLGNQKFEILTFRKVKIWKSGVLETGILVKTDFEKMELVKNGNWGK